MNCTIEKQQMLQKDRAIQTIPGDKSVSHRAVILSSLATTPVQIKNFLFSEDCLNTATIFKALGVSIVHDENTLSLLISGKGLHGLTPFNGLLDAGNSGTGIRLITGVLAGQSFQSRISGDASIQNRPMKRILDPLGQMGAHISGETRPGKSDTYPPLTIAPVSTLSPITYTLPLASAQVKSCILLAGLYVKGTTTVFEPIPCRDHTERIMSAFGAKITRNGTKIVLEGQSELVAPPTVFVPSDFSSAAFFIVLGLVLPGAHFRLTGIGLNPTRSRLLDILRAMGGNIQITPDSLEGEPYGTIEVYESRLTNHPVDPKDVAFIIDEVPILAVAALFAEGTFQITDASELRVKESDRIRTVCQMVSAFGGQVEELEDGFILKGRPQWHSFEVDSHGDHRIAMSAMIAAIASGQTGVVHNCDCIRTSFPNFFTLLKSIGVVFSFT